MSVLKSIFKEVQDFYWLSYLLEFTNFEDLKVVVNQKISDLYKLSPDLPPIEKANYYGIIFDLPMAFIESIFNIKSSANYFYLRHFSNFFIFFLSGISLLKLLNLELPTVLRLYLDLACTFWPPKHLEIVFLMARIFFSYQY